MNDAQEPTVAQATSTSWYAGDPRIVIGKASPRVVLVWTGDEMVKAVVENHHGWDIELCGAGVPGRPNGDAHWIGDNEAWNDTWLWCFPPEVSR